ncbi:MAG: hypothetical protein SCALA702_28700 [Melioribacteraceae bacterium]|nr:MAG: hypothetical protein SCALA702_28700 [Melioribacteraceae bacterium]
MNSQTNFNWMRSLIILMIISGLTFIFSRFVDHILELNNIMLFKHIFANDIGNLTNTVGGMSEVIAAVLGIEITAVAIVVQLAANKYSPKIMDIFMSNRVNQVVFSIFVITSVNTILVTNTLKEDRIPYFTLTLTLFLVVVNLLIFVPHFIYVFNFLRPQNFLTYIKVNIINTFFKLGRGKIRYSVNLRDGINEDINFIGDIALNSIYQGDRAVILLCLNTLREFTVKYLEIKRKLPEKWFKRTGLEYLDPDFSSYSSFVMNKIESRKILLERKVFRLYELIFHKAHLSLRDVAGGVLLNTELISFEAIKNKDEGCLLTVFQYFNTYLRLAITDKSPRTAFNTLEHYRIVAELLLDTNPKEVERISYHFRYYGHEASKNGVLFILETAAHDLCRLNELAYEKKVSNIEPLLRQFLNLDEPLDDKPGKDKSKEISLIGVRIAQAKLAGFYLLNNETGLAKVIFEDMKVEPLSRINKIRDIIFGTTEEEFWEVNPRGINFYFLGEKRREVLKEFFQWFVDADHK